MSLEYRGNNQELQKIFPLKIRRSVAFFVKSHGGKAKSLQKLFPDITVVVLPDYEGDRLFEFVCAEIIRDGNGKYKIESYQNLAGVYVNGRNIGKGIKLSDGRMLPPDEITYAKIPQNEAERLRKIAGEDPMRKRFLNAALCYYEARDRMIANMGERRLEDGDIISIAGETFLFSEK